MAGGQGGRWAKRTGSSKGEFWLRGSDGGMNCAQSYRRYRTQGLSAAFANVQPVLEPSSTFADTLPEHQLAPPADIQLDLQSAAPVNAEPDHQSAIFANPQPDIPYHQPSSPTPNQTSSCPPPALHSSGQPVVHLAPTLSRQLPLTLPASGPVLQKLDVYLAACPNLQLNLLVPTAFPDLQPHYRPPEWLHPSVLSSGRPPERSRLHHQPPKWFCLCCRQPRHPSEWLRTSGHLPACPPECLRLSNCPPACHPELLHLYHQHPGHDPELLCPLVLPPGCPPDLLCPSAQPPGYPLEVSCSSPVQHPQAVRLRPPAPFFSSQATCP
eukprot:superscaffoldBa00002602_g14769